MPVGPYAGANSYTGNGVTTSFAYSFRVLDEADILVTIDGVTKALTTDYTVDGVGEAGGGDVIFNAAPANAAAIVISRNRAYTRETDYQRNGSFDEETVDADFDSLVMLIQQLYADRIRAFKAPIEVSSDQVLTSAQWAARASTLLGWDENGDLGIFGAADFGVTVASAFILTLLDDADAATARATLGVAIANKGGLLAGTGGNAIAEKAVGSDGQVLVADSTQGDGLDWAYPATARSVGRNIAARTNASNPNTQIDISADELVLKDANGAAIVLSGISETADITQSGAGGKSSAAAEASNTWYYGHIVYNPSTEDVAAIIDVSWSSPTLPSNYTFSAPVTAVRNNNSSHFVGYRQDGRSVYYDDGSSATTSVLSAGSATSVTSVSLASAMPPISREVDFRLDGISTVSATNGTNSAAVFPSATVGGASVLARPVTIAGSVTGSSTAFGRIYTASQTLYYSVDSSANAPVAYINILGFSLPIGGQ